VLDARDRESVYQTFAASLANISQLSPFAKGAKGDAAMGARTLGDNISESGAAIYEYLNGKTLSQFPSDAGRNTRGQSF